MHTNKYKNGTYRKDEWRVIKTYTKECGCEYEDAENDVDRPFMCYTDYSTKVIKRCDKHAQEYEEVCAKRRAKEEHEKQIREERLQLLTLHVHDLINTEHTTYAPIKEAVNKYREAKKMMNSDRWLQRHTKYQIGDLLMIQKVKINGCAVTID